MQRIEQRGDTLTHWVTKIGRLERESDTEITEQLPDTKAAWVTVGGKSEQSGLVTLQSIDPSHTQVTLMMDFDPEGMAENIGDQLGFVDRRVQAGTDDAGPCGAVQGCMGRVRRKAPAGAASYDPAWRRAPRPCAQPLAGLPVDPNRRGGSARRPTLESRCPSVPRPATR
ncbi:SRPBCC family protein [Streptomyces virginiae]|uniref:SRPBCC family protein n=1 Tax=Streptomyces virginiae TaxID=1961 RepID=UPI0034528409